MAKVRNAEARMSKRLVLLFPGFEPLDAKAHFRRFVRGAEQTAKVWGTRIVTGALTQDGPLASFEIECDGAQTELVICDLAPVMRVMSQRNFAARIARGLLAQAGFILNGTLFSYMRTSWRYSLFFLYPLVMLGVMAGLSYWAGTIGGPFAALGLFALLLWLACRHAHFLLMMDLWHYAKALAAGGKREEQRLTDALLDAAERRVQDRAAASGLDEIVAAGHSIGAALAVELVDRLQAKSMQVPVNALTLGSGFLQVALHPKASRFRDMARRLLQGGAHWLDVQALIDPINFLHSHLDRTYAIAAPNYREIIIRMRHLLSPQTYHRIKFDMFRVHRQFVLPVEVKQGFSFHMIIAGPAPFSAIVRQGGLVDTEISQGPPHAKASA